LRSESAYGKRVDETGWYFARREAEARAGLIEAEARRVLAEAKRTEAEGRRLDAESMDIEWSVVRKAGYFGIALIAALAAFVLFLLDPAPLLASGGVSIVALLTWLAKRASG
jgi:hypothetical protein